MPSVPKPNLRQIFTVMVLGMWAASFLADLANPKYDPPAYVNPLIMLVGGYMFATSTIAKESKPPDKKEDNAGSVE